MSETRNVPYKILCLDGGGGKGAYTLGVLREIEQLVGKPLNQEFRLFYGTSTGSIIATALACGESCDNIIKFYIEKLPSIMARFRRSSRTKALRSALTGYFGDKTFEDLTVGLSIVATNVDENRAMIFKKLLEHAHGMKASFKPGFGVTLADAVEASCSAYPFFEAKLITPTNSAQPTWVQDGGFVANNPALYALVDIQQALKLPPDQIRLLSIGTGSYPEKFPFYAIFQGIGLMTAKKLISMQFASNANAIEVVFNLLATGIEKVRVNDSFSQPELATSLFEYRPKVLNRMLGKGRESFGKHEESIRKLLR